jgi:transcriptional regulator with XRE-family HTH domain
MTDSTTDSEWLTVGKRIRTAREDVGLSIRELGRRIDVSASHVSQVERGLASFSVKALYNVVSVLGISMDSLFEEVLEGASGNPIEPQSESMAAFQNTPLDQAGIVLRGDARPSINLKAGPRWERLTAKPEVGSEFIEVCYAPAPGAEPPEDFVRHGGREYGLITAGTLNAQVGFSETQMRVGDSIAFDSSIPHRFWNSSAEPVIAVWFVLDDKGEEMVSRGTENLIDRHHGI